jgi:hypothetical protein
MAEKYIVRIEVVAPDGSVPMTLTMVARKEDIFLPGRETPGSGSVLAYLNKVLVPHA